MALIHSKDSRSVLRRIELFHSCTVACGVLLLHTSSKIAQRLEVRKWRYASFEAHPG